MQTLLKVKLAFDFEKHNQEQELFQLKVSLEEYSRDYKEYVQGFLMETMTPEITYVVQEKLRQVEGHSVNETLIIERYEDYLTEHTSLKAKCRQMTEDISTRKTRVN